MTITMNNEQFDMLLRSLSNLSDDYNDVEIREGIIRARSISRTMICDIDLRPIIGETTLPLLLLKQKLELLKCFKNSNEVNLDFIDNGENFRFNDDLTSLTFRNISDPQNWVDNKHMTEQELQSVTGIDEDDVLLTTSVDQVTSNRIKTIASVFNVEKIQFDFHENAADMFCKGQEQSAKFLKDIPTEQELDAETNISVSPFNIDHDDDIRINLYKVITQQNKEWVLTKVETSIGDVNIIIYVSKSALNSKE